jgi:hypothetical protein
LWGIVVGGVTCDDLKFVVAEGVSRALMMLVRFTGVLERLQVRRDSAENSADVYCVRLFRYCAAMGEQGGQT